MYQGEGADSKPRRCEGPKFGIVCCGSAQSFTLNILPNAFNHFKKKNWIMPKPLCGQITNAKTSLHFWLTGIKENLWIRAGFGF